MPKTCPVEVHPQAPLLAQGYNLWLLLEKNLLSLDDVTRYWYAVAKVSGEAMTREAQRGRS